MHETKDVSHDNTQHNTAAHGLRPANRSQSSNPVLPRYLGRIGAELKRLIVFDFDKIRSTVPGERADMTKKHAIGLSRGNAVFTFTVFSRDMPFRFR